MKRIIGFILIFLAVTGLFAGCVKEDSKNSAADSPAQTEASESAGTPYAFEWADMDGNTHSLSDYKGKPVYLKVWGTWCSVCISTLPDFSSLADKTEDFVVLSVVPQISGELSREELAAWLDKKGYQDIPVLYDEDAQIVSDFGISGFPAQIMFDADGVPVYGAMGAMNDDVIVEVMEKIANGEALD